MATAQPWPSSPSVRSKGTSTSSKNTSENSGAPVHRLDRPDRDAGRVHVDEQRGDAAVGRLGRAGAGRAARSAGRTGRGSSTPSGPLTRQPSSVRTARQASAAEVAAGAGLGEALAPRLVAPQQPRHHLGRQLRRGVVDHRRRQHLGHRVDAGLDEAARGERLAEVGPQQRRAAEAADRSGQPQRIHPASKASRLTFDRWAMLLVERLAGPRRAAQLGLRARRASASSAGRNSSSSISRLGVGAGRRGVVRPGRSRGRRSCAGTSSTGCAAASRRRCGGRCRCTNRCACRGWSGRRSTAAARRCRRRRRARAAGGPTMNRPLGAAATSAGKSASA